MLLLSGCEQRMRQTGLADKAANAQRSPEKQTIEADNGAEAQAGRPRSGASSMLPAQAATEPGGAPWRPGLRSRRQGRPALPA